MLHAISVSEAGRTTLATKRLAVAGPLLLTVSVQMPVPLGSRLPGQDSFAAISAGPRASPIVQVKDAVPVVPQLSVAEMVTE